MNPINRISDAGFSPRLPQSAVSAKPRLAASELMLPPAKPDSNEAYLSSSRPTRLSMEMIAQMRGRSGK